MKKNWLLSLFLASLLFFSGYALATPETDEVTESLELLENVAEKIDEILPDFPITRPARKLEGPFAGASNALDDSHFLSDDSEEDESDGFFGLIFPFFTDPLPLPEQDDHHGDLSSHVHGIPEPMTFDMVRPLGAKKGELEMNILSLGGWRNGKFATNWAPEVEYAFRDGMAVEFELPMHSLKADGLKAAFQLTLPSRSERFIHGFQFFNEYHLQSRHLGMTAMHLTGFRLTERLSVVSINGVHNANLLRKPELAAITNHTLFYRLSDKMTLGVESNLFLRRKENSYLIFPQLHLELNRHYSLQVGAGFRKSPEHPFVPTLGLRVIRTL